MIKNTLQIEINSKWTRKRIDELSFNNDYDFILWKNESLQRLNNRLWTKKQTAYLAACEYLKTRGKL